MLDLVDSHCHLDFSVFDDDRMNIITNARKLGVNSFIMPAVKSSAWSQLLNIASKVTGSYFSLGLHPYFINEHHESDLEHLELLLQQHNCVAVGECGLDSSCDDIPLQKMYFLKQIELANNYSKPLIVHHRQSHHLIFQCFKQIRPQFGGVIHAFSGSEQDAQKYIDLGFMLGVGGVITYERASKTRNVFKKIPLQHIVLETDAPDMPLFGQQGLRNEPANIVLIARELAMLKGIDVGQIASQTTSNCRQLFDF